MVAAQPQFELVCLRLLLRALLATLSGALLAIGFLNVDYYLFAWIAFVPLLVASEQVGLLTSYGLALTGGFTAFAVGTYWIVDFIEISKGYNPTDSLLLASLLWFYCAHSLALIFMLFRWLHRRSPVHVFLLFPVTVVVVNASFPMMFSMKLGETQVGFPQALQAVELTGVYGLSFIIALVNVMLWRLLSYGRGALSCTKICTENRTKIRAESHRVKKNRSNPSILVSGLIFLFALSAVGAWFIYGTQRFTSVEEQVAQWGSLKVGLVQPNERPTLGKTSLVPGYARAYPPELDMSERLSAAGAELVIWPEGSRKGVLDNDRIQAAYHKAVSNSGIGLLFQDTDHSYDSVSGRLNSQYNSAVMMSASSLDREPQIYRKIKRIPLGEYLPLVSDSSFLRPWAEEFIGEFLNEISPAEEHAVFSHQRVNFVPLICYETTFPRFVASAVNHAYRNTPRSEPKILVALTNDGWFGTTHQPLIHVYGSIMRAVEQGLPLVHVANNGPSIVVSPSGKVLFQTALNTAGGYLVDVPYSASTGNTFFSRFPYFEHVMQILLGVFVMLAVHKKRPLHEPISD